MTSSQISLAVMHLFFAFVFRKQEIRSECTYFKKKVQMWSPIERRKLQRCVTCYIKSSINIFLSFAEGNVLDFTTCMQC